MSKNTALSHCYEPMAAQGIPEFIKQTTVECLWTSCQFWGRVKRSFVTTRNRRCWMSRTAVHAVSSGIGTASSSKSSGQWPISHPQVVGDAGCSSQGSGIQVDHTGGRHSTQARSTVRTCPKQPTGFYLPQTGAARRVCRQ